MNSGLPSSIVLGKLKGPAKHIRRQDSLPRKGFLIVSSYLRTHCNLPYSLTGKNFSLSVAGIFEMADNLLSKPKSSRHILSSTLIID